jgi:alpha-D-ribose 1-methylphosphonate 5-triphosphate synthase subunit PhnG
MPPGEKAPPSDPSVSETQRCRDSLNHEPLTTGRRAELLAVAEESDLVEVAERCLQAVLDDEPETIVVEPPTVGTIPLSVREPVVGQRFILADVLATQAEVEHRGHRGWAMRLGDNATAALAAAICDAEAGSGGGLADEVELLCRRTERNLADRAASEWEELARTEVRFEELV